MEYLSSFIQGNLKKARVEKEANDAGAFMKEVNQIDRIIEEINRKIVQHEDPNSMRHDDAANLYGSEPVQAPAYRPETLEKMRATVEALGHARELASEVGRLFAYEYEYEDDFNQNFKG